jgi:very-short-patch-repair endonuclease
MLPKRSFARHLRRAMTKAESELWTLLRDRRFHGYKFRRQVPIDRFVVDFLCLEARMIIEVDGKHHEPQANLDAARTGVLRRLGFEVVRFTNDEVLLHPEPMQVRLKAMLDRRVVE